MTKLIHKTGDLFSTTAGAIGHGVNTKGVMGAGIALQFRKKFPAMFELYRDWCQEGDIEPADSMIWYDEPSNLLVCNIASQDLPGPHAKMEWLIPAVRVTLEHLEKLNIKTLALPRIGSGLGGLDETEVEAALTKLAESSTVDIELWTFKV